MIYNYVMNKFIYFAQRHSDNLIKIGFSTCVPERMAYLRRKFGSMELLGLLRAGSMNDETRLHYRFRNICVTGEWFTPSPELIDYISEIGTKVL